MTARHLIAHEHETLRRAPHGPLSAEAHAAFLRQLPALPVGALTPTHDGLRTSSLCGLVRAGGWNLEILPKIYDSTTHVPDRGLLVGMLADCFNVPVWQGDTAESGTADLLTIIIRAFLYEARSQLRQGWLKAYITIEERLARPRGRLMLQEQVRRGRAHAHTMQCAFDELTVNHAHNQVVKAAMRVAKKELPVGSQLATLTERLEFSLDDVADIPLGADEIDRLPRQRLTQRYDRLLVLSSWLLRLLGPDVLGGTAQGLALLFDMNRLFQDYVGNALDGAIRRHPLRTRLRLTRERPIRALVADASACERFMMKPDLCLHFDNRLIAILDTKWKRLLPDELKAGVDQPDLYQLLAYGHTYRCDQLTLIYPEHPELSNWNRPTFRFAPHTPTAIGLNIITFDIERARVSADRLLETQLAGLEHLAHACERPVSRVSATYNE